MSKAVGRYVCAAALGVLGLAAISAPAGAHTPARALPSHRVSVQTPKHFIAYFEVAARRSGRGPIGQLHSVVALVGIPRRSRVEIRCTRACTRHLRKAARWGTSGTGMAIGLSIKPKTIVRIQVTAPNGGVRIQRYRFSRTRSALLIHEIKAKPKRTGSTTPTAEGPGSTNTGSISPRPTTTGSGTLGTSPAGDKTAPTAPTGLATSAITQTAFTLSWTKSTDDVGVTGYTVWVNGSQVATVPGGTSYAFSGRTCGTTYQLGVKAFDAAGNSSSAATVSVKTAACPDTAAPTTPSGLSASGATQTGITLNWGAASDNVGVTGYSVWRNGSQVGTVTGTSYGFSGLACGTTYQLGVKAFDAAGNTSGISTLSAGTASCPPPPPAPSVTISKGPAHSSGWWVSVQVNNFPTGTFSYSCHDSTGTFYTGTVPISNPNQFWSTGYCWNSAGYTTTVVVNGVTSNAVRF